MSIIATLVAGALPKLLLGALSDWQKNRALADGSAVAARRDVWLAAINGETERRKARSDERKAQFEFPLFWYPWMVAAIPWSIWLGLGILDSIAFLDFLPLAVHQLPPQIEQHSSAISFALFGAGGGVQLGQGFLRAWAAK